MLFGMVQAWVGHNVTPLKFMYDKSDWRVTSLKPHKTHKWPNKHHHHGDGAANPSSGVDLMNQMMLEGRAAWGMFFQDQCRGVLLDSLKKIFIYLHQPCVFNQIQAHSNQHKFELYLVLMDHNIVVFSYK